MKLQAPKGKTGELHLNGRSFVIARDGTVEVPDEFVNSSVWSQGYTAWQPEQPEQTEQPVAVAAEKSSKEDKGGK